MGQPLRFTPPGFPAHVWIRGNQKQNIFSDEVDRQRYLTLLIQHSQEHKVGVLAYCLMSNHVHLVLRPTTEDGISWTMMRVNSEFAKWMQSRLGRMGHFWQRRFKAAILDGNYLWTALRYVELNPVRAGMVQSAEQWPWSSAGAHLGTSSWPEWLESEPWKSRFGAGCWRTELASAISPSAGAEIRRATRQNRPLAEHAQVRRWETNYRIQLTPKPNGRPKKKDVIKEMMEPGFFTQYG